MELLGEKTSSVQEFPATPVTVTEKLWNADRDLEWWRAAAVTEKSWKFDFVLFVEILPKKAWSLRLVKCDSRMTSDSWGCCGCYASTYLWILSAPLFHFRKQKHNVFPTVCHYLETMRLIPLFRDLLIFLILFVGAVFVPFLIIIPEFHSLSFSPKQAYIHVTNFKLNYCSVELNYPAAQWDLEHHDRHTASCCLETPK